MPSNGIVWHCKDGNFRKRITASSQMREWDFMGKVKYIYLTVTPERPSSGYPWYNVLSAPRTAWLDLAPAELSLGRSGACGFVRRYLYYFYDTCAGSSTEETSTEEVDGDKLISFKASAPSQEERPPAVCLYIIQTWMKGLQNKASKEPLQSINNLYLVSAI